MTQGQHDRAVTENPVVPVTLITGFLGAGKTSLINHVLAGDNGQKFAVIVNEFGAIGIDHDLIVSSTETLLELSNGCVCCTIRGDLVTTLRDLLARSEDYDGIFIETTGLADPAPVIQTFMFDQLLASKAYLDAVVTVIDAHHFASQVERFPEALHQLLYANVVIVNKTESCSASALDALTQNLRALNAHALLHFTENAAVPFGSITGQNAFDMERLVDEFAGAGKIDAGDGAAERPAHDFAHDDAAKSQASAHNVTSQSFASAAPLDLARLEAWLNGLLQKHGQDILRMKGIFQIAGREEKLVFQAVHMMSDARWVDVWAPGELRQSRLVIIGQQLDQLALADFDLGLLVTQNR